MNLESERTLEDRNRKRPNIRIKTDQYYHAFNYNNAISSQIHNFGWDETRLFKPAVKNSFNFELVKYDFGSGKYYQYFTKEDIKHYESLGITKKNKSPERIQLFSPKPVKKFEIEKKSKQKKEKMKNTKNEKINEKRNEKTNEKRKNKKINVKIKKRSFCCSIQ